ncbi:hypothetical protein BGW37DRAFT_475451 [Umbelopsis sp. PMI_123]|nr:hypothetical protein BGW37DRAFT_475451 [Umbelopsis sp. PMI_123]
MAALLVSLRLLLLPQHLLSFFSRFSSVSSTLLHVLEFGCGLLLGLILDKKSEIFPFLSGLSLFSFIVFLFPYPFF